MAAPFPEWRPPGLRHRELRAGQFFSPSAKIHHGCRTFQDLGVILFSEIDEAELRGWQDATDVHRIEINDFFSVRAMSYSHSWQAPVLPGSFAIGSFTE
jgi:hypothetical protein